MENRFETFKKIILDRAKKAEACIPQYRRAYKSESFEELITVIRDNFFWCVDTEVIDGQFIDEHKEEFAKERIWHNENICEGYMIVSGSASVRAYGSASVRAYGSASVEAYGSASVRAYGSASVRAYGSAYVDSCSIIECELSDYAIARVYNNKICYASDNIKFEKIEE